MTAHSGRTLLLKVDAASAGTFQTVGGLRVQGLELSQDLVDVTHGESTGRWRELLGDAGLRRGRVSGSGLFRDSASDELVRQLFFDGVVAPWQLIVPSFGTIEGPFVVSALDYEGRHDDAITFALTLESAGPLTFAALA
ncbi:MAG: phage major tail protein, TP901-1 family [Devosiaceae bacterium]|nr:phage major tail protein, TP901-1 family [Devosiaceae bacterium MH13]